MNFFYNITNPIPPNEKITPNSFMALNFEYLEDHTRK